MVSEFGWVFVLFSTVFVVFVLVVALSRFGTIRLGAADEKPEFRTASWIAMMFAAGMGIGLMFYGASEPLIFFRDGVPGHGTGDVSASMSSALFHWTLPPLGVVRHRRPGDRLLHLPDRKKAAAVLGIHSPDRGKAGGWLARQVH